MEAPALSELNRLSVLWRRKWILLGTVLIVVLATELVSKSLTPVYETSSTLIIAQPGRSLTFDTAQANEEAARSYAQILSSPNFASQVAQAVGHGATESSVSSKVTVQAVANTALMTITADDPSPAQAKRIADAYAQVFVTYTPRLAAQTKATATIADNAPIPTSPVRPKPTLYGLAAAILGIMAGVALAFLRERFDVRLRTVPDIAAHADLPVLATVPIRTDPQSMGAFAEAFRLLRTTLRFIDQAGAIRSIAVTSWTEGEGKSTLASQLALTVSASGTHTLIVDGDVHRPGLGKLLLERGAKPAQPGLSDYVLGAAALEECLHATRVPALTFMPSGRQVPNLSSLLETRRGRSAFEELGGRSDFTIIDCPPLAVGADAPTIAGHVDGVILVVDLRRATKTTLDDALRQLAAVNAAVLGIVVNRDRAHSAQTYYDYTTQHNGSTTRKPPLRERARRALQRNG